MAVEESSELIIGELRNKLAEMTASREKVARELTEAWRREQALQARLDKLEERIPNSTASHTEPLYDGVKVLDSAGQVIGEVRQMRDGITWNAVPFDHNRPNQQFNSEAQAVQYVGGLH